MELNLIGISNNGINVYRHPESHSHRPELDAEVISKITLPEDSTFFRETIDMGRIIGKDHLVETEEGDVIVWLQRGNRPGLSRMVLKEADDTSLVTFIACVARKDDTTPDELVGKWILVTLFEGKQGEREPFDNSFTNGKNPEGKATAERFWKTHGLVPTDEELEQIEISNVEVALAICDLLVYEMKLEFREHVQVFWAARSDIYDSWKKEVYYPNGSHGLEPAKTIEDIQDIIDWHIEGYARNPEGYDY